MVKISLLMLILMASFFAFGQGLDIGHTKKCNVGFIGWLSFVCFIVIIVILM